MPREARAALAELDRAIAARPHVAGQSFSAAAQKLCALRDRLATEAGDAATRRRRLAHVNAVISVVLAGHFPLGAVPWDELDRARTWLADLAAESAT
jgi:hypothetical protein